MSQAPSQGLTHRISFSMPTTALQGCHLHACVTDEETEAQRFKVTQQPSPRAWFS